MVLISFIIIIINLFYVIIFNYLAVVILMHYFFFIASWVKNFLFHSLDVIWCPEFFFLNGTPIQGTRKPACDCLLNLTCNWLNIYRT